MEYIRIGTIVNTFGIKGELKVKSYSDFNDERYKKGNTVYLFVNKEYIPFTVSSYKNHRGMILVQFKGFEDINLVERYRDVDIFVHKSQMHKLPNGEFYVLELKGLKCYDQNDNYIGIVNDVDQNNVQNILRIKTDDKEILVPYVKAFIKNVDIENNKIIINLIEGML